MSDWKLCYGCMETLGSEAVCPHCGYDQNTTSLVNYIKPGSMLQERFLVGKVQSVNGEGVTYIGYDTSVDCKILIREYFPEGLCSRVPSSTLINVGYEHLAQYKALMAEFTELNKALARLRNLSHLNPALDMFAENNTTYAVYEYLEGRTLLDYLKENAGELSWYTVRRIFPPLFTSLSLLHNAGVLHRGLSPETIFVTDKGEIKLKGFCISAVRTNDTELDAELFDGYAAPEQYFADRQQGTWTDVYGICAVLYRILTGCRAADAISRQDYDLLVPPDEVNPKIPANVSKGIMQGLLLDSNARVRTITDLVTLLFDEDSAAQEETPAPQPSGHSSSQKSPTAVFQPHQSHQEPEPERSAPPRQQRPAPQGNRQGQRQPQRRPAPNGQQSAPQRGGNSAARTRSGGNGQPVQRRPAAAAAGGRARTRESEISVFERIRAPLFIAILFIAIVTVVIWAFIRFWGLGAGKHILDTDDKSSANDNVIPVQTDDEGQELTYDAIVPNLVGMSYTVKRDEMDGWLYLDPEYEFSDVYAKDIIFWQELDPETEFVSGSTMKVKVSLGSSILTMPAFKGMKLTTYLKKLESMGFVPAIDGGGNNNITPGGQSGFGYSYGNGQGYIVTKSPQEGGEETVTTTTSKNGKHQVVKYVATINYEYSNGYVCDVEPEVGKIVDAMDDYEITVYYAYNPVANTGILSPESGTTTTGTVTSSKATTSATTHTTARETTAATDPPVTETDPPATVPPVTDPPATEPPPPPATDPPPDNPEE